MTREEYVGSKQFLVYFCRFLKLVSSQVVPILPVRGIARNELYCFKLKLRHCGRSTKFMPVVS